MIPRKLIIFTIFLISLISISGCCEEVPKNISLNNNYQFVNQNECELAYTKLDTITSKTISDYEFLLNMSNKSLNTCTKAYSSQAFYINKTIGWDYNFYNSTKLNYAQSREKLSHVLLVAIIGFIANIILAFAVESKKIRVSILLFTLGFICWILEPIIKWWLFGQS